MITRHDNTTPDSVSESNAQRSPAPTSALSPQLREALRQWDDTNADTLAASKERLIALGSSASVSLAAFLRRRLRISVVGTVVGILNFALIYVVMFVWSLHHDSREPFTFVINAIMIGLISVSTVGMGVGAWAVSGLQHHNGMKALAETNPVMAVRLLADFWISFSESTKHRTAAKMPLLTALRRLLNCDTLPSISLSERQRRNLRRTISSVRYSDLTTAIIQLFIRTEDASAVAQVRRVAKQSRVWEVREAANEYLARFAPEEAARLEPTGAGSIPQAGEDSILACVMRLGSRNETERQTAQTALYRMNAAQLEQVLHTLGREPVEGRRLGNILYAICIAAGAVIGSLTYLPCIHSPYYDSRMSLIVAFGCAVGGGAFGWLAGANVNYARRNRDRAQMLGCDNGIFPEKRLLESLETLDNPALLGTLISQMPPDNGLIPVQRYRRSAALKAIIRILSRLQASDTALLDDTARGLLNQQLAKGRQSLSEVWGVKREIEEQAAYDVAILKAWEQVGDERALPCVEKLASLSARSPAQKRVQQAAHECLPYLQARADRQQVAQTLLRAAQPPVEPSDVLLRAATVHAAHGETEQLLRASSVKR